MIFYATLIQYENFYSFLQLTNCQMKKESAVQIIKVISAPVTNQRLLQSAEIINKEELFVGALLIKAADEVNENERSIKLMFCFEYRFEEQVVESSELNQSYKFFETFCDRQATIITIILQEIVYESKIYIAFQTQKFRQYLSQRLRKELQKSFL